MLALGTPLLNHVVFMTSPSSQILLENAPASGLRVTCRDGFFHALLVFELSPVACGFHVSSHFRLKTLRPVALEVPRGAAKTPLNVSAARGRSPPLPPVGGFGLWPGQGRRRSRRLTPTRPDLKGLRPRAGRVGVKREEDD